MLVLDVVLKTGEDGLVCHILVEDVVVFVRYWIEPSLLKLLVDQVLREIKRDEYVWLLVELLQHVYLVHRGWSSHKDPTVSFAVLHVQSLAQEFHDYLILDRVTFFDFLPELVSVIAFSSNAVLHHLVHVDVYQLVLGRDLLGMMLDINPRWAHHDDLRWLPRGVRILQVSNSSHVLNDHSLALVAVNFIDSSHELLLDTLDVDSVFGHSVMSDLV